MTNKYDISFVIIAWNSERFIKNCLDSIINKCEGETLTYQIYVVDNGSSDSSREILDDYCRRYEEGFIVDYLSTNSGTTYSRNIALKKVKSDFVCILDSDTQIREGSLSAILDSLRSDDSIGMLVPRLILPSGIVQNSVKRFPTFVHKLLKIPQAVFKIKTIDRDFYPSFPFDSRMDVDTAISACWFFRSDLLQTVGYLDEEIFYSPEDLDYCVRVRKSGKRIVYEPSFVVFHDTQQISHKKPFSKVSISHFNGLVYYFKKHGGWFSTRHLTR